MTLGMKVCLFLNGRLLTGTESKMATASLRKTVYSELNMSKHGLSIWISVILGDTSHFGRGYMNFCRHRTKIAINQYISGGSGQARAREGNLLCGFQMLSYGVLHLRVEARGLPSLIIYSRRFT